MGLESNYRLLWSVVHGVQSTTVGFSLSAKDANVVAQVQAQHAAVEVQEGPSFAQALESSVSSGQHGFRTSALRRSKLSPRIREALQEDEWQSGSCVGVLIGIMKACPGHRRHFGLTCTVFHHAPCKQTPSIAGGQVLQAKVMTFVNQIAEIVHGVVDEFHGAANKNNGETFLLVWRTARTYVWE
eukprot:1452546-Amphidinium_carterae.1